MDAELMERVGEALVERVDVEVMADTLADLAEGAENERDEKIWLQAFGILTGGKTPSYRRIEQEQADKTTMAWDSFNETWLALPKLYEVYCKYGYRDGLTKEALAKLMDAYAGWARS